MSLSEWVPSNAGCDVDWCSTDHSSLAHPDDDDHRSVGLAVTAEVRDGRSGTISSTVEIGLLQRTADIEPWFVIEDGDGVHLEVTLDSARRMIHQALRNDDIRSALGL